MEIHWSRIANLSLLHGPQCLCRPRTVTFKHFKGTAADTCSTSVFRARFDTSCSPETRIFGTFVMKSLLPGAKAKPQPLSMHHAGKTKSRQSVVGNDSWQQSVRVSNSRCLAYAACRVLIALPKRAEWLTVSCKAAEIRCHREI